MRFNEPVEMLGVGTSGWAQVRILQSDVVGFVPPHNLSTKPVDASQPFRYRRPRPIPKPPKARKGSARGPQRHVRCGGRPQVAL